MDDELSTSKTLFGFVAWLTNRNETITFGREYSVVDCLD